MSHPALTLKSGVSLNGCRIEILRTIPDIMLIFHQHGVAPVVTSGTDGTHSPRSLHYEGLALDWRTRDLPGGPMGKTAEIVRDLIADRLGAAYDVVQEATHIHVEYDPS